MISKNMIIAFDFDGVIHRYSKGWQDGSIYDPISTKWIELVNDLLLEGHGVFIMSTRPKRQIYKHMKELYYLPVYKSWKFSFSFRIMPFWEKFYKKREIDGIASVGICNHKAVFDILIDDRAICFTGDFTGMKEKIERFQPWGKSNDT